MYWEVHILGLYFGVTSTLCKTNLQQKAMFPFSECKGLACYS